jgi:hypothetical protein
MNLLADAGITSGHATLADFCWLVAVIVGIILIIMYLMERAISSVLMAVIVTLIALGLFLA